MLIGGASKSPQHGDLSGLVVGDQETLVHVVPLRVATVAETLAIHVAAEVRINAEKENLDVGTYLLACQQNQDWQTSCLPRYIETH